MEISMTTQEFYTFSSELSTLSYAIGTNKVSLKIAMEELEKANLSDYYKNVIKILITELNEHRKIN